MHFLFSLEFYFVGNKINSRKKKEDLYLEIRKQYYILYILYINNIILYKWLYFCQNSILYRLAMRPLIYMFLIFASFSTSQVYGDDKSTESIKKYDDLINEYYELVEDQENEEDLSTGKVIIYDINGQITRQANIKGEIVFSTPSILKPVINKAVFLTKINDTYYYLYDQN
jgi:hypothetical protein